jgi:hypothetical protein
MFSYICDNLLALLIVTHDLEMLIANQQILVPVLRTQL